MYLPRDVFESNIRDRQRAIIILVTVSHLVGVTVVSGDKKRIVDIF